jgi:hypothetical protein
VGWLMALRCKAFCCKWLRPLMFVWPKGWFLVAWCEMSSVGDLRRVGNNLLVNGGADFQKTCGSGGAWLLVNAGADFPISGHPTLSGRFDCQRAIGL